jgi:hypothetical protein
MSERIFKMKKTLLLTFIFILLIGGAARVQASGIRSELLEVSGVIFAIDRESFLLTLRVCFS